MFLCLNAFERPLKDEDIFETEINSSVIDFITTDSLNEQFEKLDINGDLSLSILSGLVKLGGSASYLNSHKNTTNSAHMTLTYSVHTVNQKLNGIHSKVNADSFNEREATHIVVGIDWGAKCNITCEYQKSQNEDEMQVNGKLHSEIDRLKDILSVKGSTDLNAARKSDGSASKFSYHTKCDVTDLEKDIPTTFEGALAVAVSLPKAVMKTNGGKGIPLKYTMKSLNSLRPICKLEIKLDQVGKEIEKHTTKKCFQTMQASRKSCQQVNDLIGNFSENKDAVPSEDLDAANELLNKFEIEEAKFKSHLREALTEARSGKEGGLSAIEDALTSFINGDFSPKMMSTHLEKYAGTLQKLKLIKELKSKHVLYIGKESSVESALFENANKEVYTFYLDYRQKYQNGETWRKNLEELFKLISAHKNKEEVQVIAVDCEFKPEVVCKPGECIELYKDGILCREDKPQESVTSKERKQCKEAESRVSSPKLEKESVLRTHSVKEINIVLLGGIGVGKSTWINAVANYFAFATLGDAIDAEGMKVHIPSHFYYTTQEGETKKIIVASEADHKIRGNVHSATIGQGVCRICGRNHDIGRTYTLGVRNAKGFDGETEKILTGSEAVQKIGEKVHSATKGPKEYRICGENYNIRLIDTPGVRNAGSLEQDENFQSILAHLSYYDTIHGICILLTESFLLSAEELLITELLTHLHKSAAENIIFCFRYKEHVSDMTRSPVLKSLPRTYHCNDLLVSPSNQFYFDNETFRFLACLKNGVQFSEQEIDTYSSNWDKASIGIERLFEHVQGLTPHSIQSTIRFNKARKIILGMSQPLAETAVAFQVKIFQKKRASPFRLWHDRKSLLGKSVRSFTLSINDVSFCQQLEFLFRLKDA